jgi:hypothetical protein
MNKQELMAHLNKLTDALNVGRYHIPIEDVKTVDFSDPNKVVVETFDGFTAEETNVFGVAELKAQLDWKE